MDEMHLRAWIAEAARRGIKLDGVNTDSHTLYRPSINWQDTHVEEPKSYEEWQREGFQVLRGQKALVRRGNEIHGVPLFFRSQVKAKSELTEEENRAGFAEAVRAQRAQPPKPKTLAEIMTPPAPPPAIESKVSAAEIMDKYFGKEIVLAKNRTGLPGMFMIRLTRTPKGKHVVVNGVEIEGAQFLDATKNETFAPEHAMGCGVVFRGRMSASSGIPDESWKKAVWNKEKNAFLDHRGEAVRKAKYVRLVPSDAHSIRYVR